MRKQKPENRNKTTVNRQNCSLHIMTDIELRTQREQQTNQRKRRKKMRKQKSENRNKTTENRQNCVELRRQNQQLLICRNIVWL